MNKRPKKTIQLCIGCRDNFYNGNNNLGVKKCWNFSSSKIKKRLLIPVDMRPPYLFEPNWVLSCYHPERTVNVDPKAIDKDGYWNY